MFAISFDAGKNVPFNLTVEQVTTLLSHPNVHQHLVMIGLKNVLQDCHASIVRDDFKSEDEYFAAKRAKAELKLGAMMAGELRAHSGERKVAVPTFTNEARKLVLSKLDKAAKEKLAAMPDSGAATLDAMFAKNEAALKPIVEATIAEMERKAKAKAELEGKLDLSF